jgi:hypothetical protein
MLSTWQLQNPQGGSPSILEQKNGPPRNTGDGKVATIEVAIGEDRRRGS